MKGLLQKDFYLMRTLARSYAFILGVFFLLSLTGVYDGTFLCTFLVLMCVMIPANTFSYDEQAKWDKYAASLPAGRPGVVRAKYLFTLLVSLAALALAALLQALLFFLGRAGTATLLEAELSAVAPAGFGILMTAILLPLLFRFGSQRGRLYLVLVVAVLTGGTVGGAMVLSEAGLGASILLTLLAAAQQIAGIGNAAVLALGSDGTDGPTDAAGGVVDGASRALLEAQGLRIPAILDENDAYNGLKACDGLLITGPTGTNVNDVSIVLVGG